MERYQCGKIYSIRSNATDDVYIGSTCLSLAKRLYAHRKSKKYYENGKTNYITSFKILEHPDHYIELIEAYPCNNKMELERREGEIMRTYANRVNRCIAGQPREVYDKEYRDTHKEQIKEYREAHKERRGKKILCICGKTYAHGHKSHHEKSKYHIATVAFIQHE